MADSLEQRAREFFDSDEYQGDSDFHLPSACQFAADFARKIAGEAMEHDAEIADDFGAGKVARVIRAKRKELGYGE